MRGRKIYIASSWKNEVEVIQLAIILRDEGYEVYAFCEREIGHFVFSPHDFQGDITKITAKEAMKQEVFTTIYRSNKAGLDWSDTVVILLPAGKSTHLEGGYAVGRGKQLFVLGDPVPGDFDAMYGFAEAVCETVTELEEALK